jgi:hypothetical protein
MQQAVETIGREADDVSGERAFERARAVGASIRRARGALASALGQLDAGTRELADEFAGFKRGCGTFAASLTTAPGGVVVVFLWPRRPGDGAVGQSVITLSHLPVMVESVCPQRT